MGLPSPTMILVALNCVSPLIDAEAVLQQGGRRQPGPHVERRKAARLWRRTPGLLVLGLGGWELPASQSDERSGGSAVVCAAVVWGSWPQEEAFRFAR